MAIYSLRDELGQDLYDEHGNIVVPLTANNRDHALVEFGRILGKRLTFEVQENTAFYLLDEWDRPLCPTKVTTHVYEISN